MRALVKSKLIFRHKVIPPDPTNSNKEYIPGNLALKTKLTMTDWQKTTTETGVSTKVISG